ncbi:hypothetical protein [Salinibacter altiplanensis]|uniref:hypothetical protein n=1 Tax=Salinibacter altiplanensis TaxID=1803181 RepID=UPI001F438843|nr:hypothetical protein [Salinibacter altiplanensis]
MRSSWLTALLVGGGLIASLAACTDSSDVGLGVGSDPLQGDNPATVDAVPDVGTTRVPPITGDNVRNRPRSQSAWRFLVGSVDDPVSGTGLVEAEGYVDFAGRSNDVPSEIENASPDARAAELRLKTDYFHGHSTESIDVEVYDLTEEADMDSARATASFNADASPVSVDTAQINLSDSDSLVTIRLQESWVNDHPEVFQTGEDFESNFHGFKITAPSSEAVVGFSSSDATLRLRTVSSGETTTADYSGLQTFTHVEQRSAGDPPSGYRLMQDGVGTGLTMEWSFDENPLDTLESAPLNRAEIFVPNDTSALDSLDSAENISNFERPQPQGYRIIATRASSPDVPLCREIQSTVFPISDEDCTLPLDPTAAPTAALVPDNISFPIFQQSLQRVRSGQSPVFTTFRVHIADRANTSVNQATTIQPGLPTTLPALVPKGGTEPKPPRATLTVTPL